jgi:hypothetical protein
MIAYYVAPTYGFLGPKVDHSSSASKSPIAKTTPTSSPSPTTTPSVSAVPPVTPTPYLSNTKSTVSQNTGDADATPFPMPDPLVGDRSQPFAVKSTYVSGYGGKCRTYSPQYMDSYITNLEVRFNNDLGGTVWIYREFNTGEASTPVSRVGPANLSMMFFSHNDPTSEGFGYILDASRPADSPINAVRFHLSTAAGSYTSPWYNLPNYCQ